MNSYLNSEFENNIKTISKEPKNHHKDIFLFQKLKNTVSDLQSEKSQLRQEIYQLKETNNHLISENQNLTNLLKIYKDKENLLLLTQESLKNLNEEYDSLKSSLLEERNKFLLELRLKQSIYDHDVIQTNMHTDNIKNQIDIFSNIKKLNDILYIKNDELKKNMEQIKIEEKAKIEEMEIKYIKKMDNYKRKMIQFLKKNEEERLKLGTQSELNSKLNILHIQELINELEIQGVEVEDLLKERQELKMTIMALNHDLYIYQELIDIMTKKNHNFQNKLKKCSNSVKEYNLLTKKSHGTPLILTEPNDKSLNILKLKKLEKRRNLSTKNKNILKVINNKIDLHNKFITRASSKKTIPSFSYNDNKVKVIKSKNKNIKNDDNENKENNENSNIKTQNNIYFNEYNDKKKYKDNKSNFDLLLKEREKYKDLYEFYKDKLDLIKNKYTNIFKMYDEVLERIYNEDIIKNNKENIIININEFKEIKFEKLTPEQKYAILIKLINNIAPLVYKKDLENNSFIQNISNVKEKYNFNGLNSVNYSSQNSAKMLSMNSAIFNLKMKNQNKNSSFRTMTTLLGSGIKYNKSLNSFDDFKKLFGKQKEQRNKSSLHYGNSKIDIDLYPKIKLLE